MKVTIRCFFSCLFLLFMSGAVSAQVGDPFGEGDPPGEGDPEPFFGAFMLEAKQNFLQEDSDEAEFYVECIWGGVGDFVGQFTFLDNSVHAPYKVWDESYQEYAYDDEIFTPGTNIAGVWDWDDFPLIPFTVLDPVAAFSTFDAKIFYHTSSTGSLETGEFFSIKTWDEALENDRYDIEFLGELPHISLLSGTYLDSLPLAHEFRFWPRFNQNFISTCNDNVPAGRMAVLDVLNFSDLDGNGNPKWEYQIDLDNVDELEIKRAYFEHTLNRIDHVSRVGTKKIHFRVRIVEADGSTAVNSLNEPLVITGSSLYIN